MRIIIDAKPKEMAALLAKLQKRQSGKVFIPARLGPRVVAKTIGDSPILSYSPNEDDIARAFKKIKLERKQN